MILTQTHPNENLISVRRLLKETHQCTAAIFRSQHFPRDLRLSQFRAAAAQLGVTSSALSHSIRQLEERLGIRLLHRTMRSVSLTDSGVRLLERLRPGMEQITGALEEPKDQQHRPSGRLRIYTQNDWAVRMVIASIWERFLSCFPEVHLELCVQSAPMDLVATGFDAGLAVRSRMPAEAMAIRVSNAIQVAVVGSRG